MAVEVKLPELGENISSGSVANILVKTGDRIEKDSPLVELETDKAVLEVPAPQSGTVAAIHISTGDTVAVGQLIITLEPGDVDSAESTDTPQPADAQAAESSPPAVDTPAPTAAPSPPDAGSTPAPGPQDPAVSPPMNLPDEPIPATPAVRRLAREIGVDIKSVRGSGSAGRITMDDVKLTAKRLLSGAGAAPSATAPSVALPDFSRWGEVERQALGGVRRATARHLSQAWSLIPHVTQHDMADITELEILRKRYGAMAEAAGGKLTVTAILLKVVAAALRKFPRVNASIDMATEEAILKHYVHIGVAVDTEHGLLVPVIRDVDKKGIIELSVELGVVARKARDRKLGIDEMQGGTFSVTNLGGIGGSHFTPLVNHPEVAILGVSRAKPTPTYVDGNLQPRLLMPLSLSYDHRLVDGAEGIRFLRWIIDALEQPFLLALEN